MARRKYPSELNTRHVRVSLGDYALLTEVSRRAGVTMAEALHLLLERQEREPERGHILHTKDRKPPNQRVAKLRNRN